MTRATDRIIAHIAELEQQLDEYLSAQASDKLPSADSWFRCKSGRELPGDFDPLIHDVKIQIAEAKHVLALAERQPKDAVKTKENVIPPWQKFRVRER